MQLQYKYFVFFLSFHRTMELYHAGDKMKLAFKASRVFSKLYWQVSTKKSNSEKYFSFCWLFLLLLTRSLLKFRMHIFYLAMRSFDTSPRKWKCKCKWNSIPTTAKRQMISMTNIFFIIKASVNSLSFMFTCPPFMTFSTFNAITHRMYDDALAIKSGWEQEIVNSVEIKYITIHIISLAWRFVVAFVVHCEMLEILYKAQIHGKLDIFSMLYCCCCCRTDKMHRRWEGTECLITNMAFKIRKAIIVHTMFRSSFQCNGCVWMRNAKWCFAFESTFIGLWLSVVPTAYFTYDLLFGHCCCCWWLWWWWWR